MSTPESIVPDPLAPEAVDAERLRLWLEGERPQPDCADLLVLSGADPRVAARTLSAAATAFVPREEAPHVVSALSSEGGSARVVAYEGELDLTGGEIVLGNEFIVQTESYATAPYVATVVPTAFSVVDELDLRALRSDRDLAIGSGSFPEYLRSPLTTLVDLHAWLAPIVPVELVATRVMLSADGRLTDGPCGAELVSGTLTIDRLPVPAVDDAAELARFLGAARVMRALSIRVQAPVRIGGFGGDVSGCARMDSVFTASSAGDHFVADVSTNALSRVPEGVAKRVDVVFADLAQGAEPGTEEAELLKALRLDHYLSRVSR